MMPFKNRNIISINDLTKKDIIHILETAKKIEGMKNKSFLLRKFVMASLFYEPSTRTRLSFESAMKRLGGRIIGFSEPSMSSFAKGETIYDTIKMVEKYSDLIVIRHNLDGSARVAADATDKPVINAGDGKNQHPTQTLLDLYTIKKTQKSISKLKIAIVGDLKYGRTAHSLATALAMFGCRLFFVAPDMLKMPEYIKKQLKITYTEHAKIQDVVRKVDILYMTRIQKERFPDASEYEKVKNEFVLTKAMLKNVKPNLKILHPLPRVNEISAEVDDTQYAYYFQQAANGIPVRQALLALLLGRVR